MPPVITTLDTLDWTRPSIVGLRGSHQAICGSADSGISSVPASSSSAVLSASAASSESCIAIAPKSPSPDCARAAVGASSATTTARRRRAVTNPSGCGATG